jgi:peptidoglycan hydrolase CwlO-like protein
VGEGAYDNYKIEFLFISSYKMNAITDKLNIILAEVTTLYVESEHKDRQIEALEEQVKSMQTIIDGLRDHIERINKTVQLLAPTEVQKEEPELCYDGW